MATFAVCGVLGLDTDCFSNSNQLVMRYGAEDFIKHTFATLAISFSPDTNNPLGTLMLMDNDFQLYTVAILR